MNSWITTNVWLIPAAPLVASILILAFGKAARRAAAAVAILGQIADLTMSIFAFVPTLHSHGFRAIQNCTWFPFGEQILRIGFVLDPLAAAMLMMIALVGLCIFVFSIGYMAEDKNFGRFFAYLSFFSGAMLGVVVANSLLLLFVFWELVGLASYLLIGFWIERPSAAAAAKKAFVTTRIGDLGFFLGLLWLYGRSGTLLFYDGGDGCLEKAGLAMLGASATFIALLIFCGAMGKSGQFRSDFGLSDQAPQRRQKKRSLPLASATWDFSLACSGFTAAVARFSFTMVGTVVWRRLVLPCSVRAPRLLRCSFSAAQWGSRDNSRCTSGCRMRWKAQLRSAH